jgi:hypothetical protein
LTEFRTYLALVAYPAIVILIYDWGGPGPRWATKNRSPILPPDLKDLEERRGRFLLPFKYVFVLLALWALVGGKQWHLIASHSRSWSVLVIWGILGGLLAFCFRRALALLWPPITDSESNDHMLYGPVTLWLTILAVGAFTEELWRALCISGLQQNGYSARLADLLPAFIFSIAHMSGLPSRIPAGLEIACAEIVIGLIFGGIFVWSGNLVSPAIANVIFYTLTFFRLRQHYVLQSGTLRSR